MKYLKIDNPDDLLRPCQLWNSMTEKRTATDDNKYYICILIYIIDIYTIANISTLWVLFIFDLAMLSISELNTYNLQVGLADKYSINRLIAYIRNLRKIFQIDTKGWRPITSEENELHNIPITEIRITNSIPR